MIGRGVGAAAVFGCGSGRGRTSAWCLTVGCCHGIVGVLCGVGGVGAQVLEGLLALRDELFERSEEQLGGRWPALDDNAVGREGQALHLQDRGVLQAGAAAIGGVRALGAPRTSGGTGVETPAAARTAIHRLQEETVN